MGGGGGERSKKEPELQGNFNTWWHITKGPRDRHARGVVHEEKKVKKFDVEYTETTNPNMEAIRFGAAIKKKGPAQGRVKLPVLKFPRIVAAGRRERKRKGGKRPKKNEGGRVKSRRITRRGEKKQRGGEKRNENR